MAEKIPRPAIKLTVEMKARLAGTEPDIERAQHAIDVLKKIGMDVTELEDKLRWAAETKDILLKEFG